MSSLEPRGGRRLTRSQKTDRIYRLGLASAGLGVVGVVLAVTVSFGLGLLLIVAAVVAGVLAKRQLG